MNDSGCLNCEKRFLGCHASCDTYLNYRKRLDKIKENKIREREKYKKSYIALRKLERIYG